ncbi:TPM domain-containing protein [Pistricoccus aurantiacus]|uniref:TPM domain-containing protein n=1 Tax=Pistricoccus aurantiacus TaxID=1883414 RepID=UPI003639D537
MKGLRRLSLFALLWLCAVGVQAQQLDFPELSGRVVDQAELLDGGTETRLTRMLEAHEQATTEQIVVVTLPDLQGVSIEQYGYQLGRHWGIGQSDEDNGALLIVARDERKLRIEVGYGLEGRLTDAQSSVIINQIITPAFREGDFARGISEGTQAMIQVLGGDPLEQAAPNQAVNEAPEGGRSILFFVLLLVIAIFLGGGGRGGRSGVLGGLLLGGALGGGGHRGGGGFGGGGFSGGGGGFGGGGASGGW